ALRIAQSENESLKKELLPDLLAGRSFATVGISHLTTSRRHLGKPALSARETSQGYLLDGYSPWVTGAIAAQHVVVGATLDDGREVLLAAPTDLPGVQAARPPQLVGLNASQTGELRFDNVEVDRRYLLAGPVENVMRTGVGAGTGGLQTSTLAVGLAQAAIDFVFGEAEKRPPLLEPAEKLLADLESCRCDLLAAATGTPACSNEALRVRANSLALRASQAALAAAKGAGYVATHPAGRWCREALFFLVWSCPQPVVAANLCQLAGIAE
ncbi:MAG: acyl-CoA dehydrogenase, partial [Planctomycetales bacterium]|nr:acyl-CoA dehydrogenase [Planctomycetales bacterium]